MSRKPRVLYPNALYHVTSRGSARQTIFHSEEDRERFLKQLEDRVAACGVVVYAFVLMDNHYHLLVRTPRGNLDRFMQRVNTSYALYYRYKHRKPGHVFQGRYKALVVKDDTYLLNLSRYIHLNPVKVSKWKGVPKREAVAWLNKYRWSSYPSYISAKHPFPWLNLDLLSHYGRSRRRAAARYRAYMEAAIGWDDEELIAALRSAGEQLGSEGEDSASSRRDESPVSFSVLDRAVAAQFGIDASALREHGHRVGIGKRVAVALAVRLCGASLKAIGAHYGGISASAVNMTLRRARDADAKHVKAILQAIQSE